MTSDGLCVRLARSRRRTYIRIYVHVDSVEYARGIAKLHFHVGNVDEGLTIKFPMVGVLFIMIVLENTASQGKLVEWRRRTRDSPCMSHIRNVERPMRTWERDGDRRCGARLWRSLPYKYFLDVDVLGDILCTELQRGGIDYRISNYPSARIIRQWCLRGRAPLSVLLNDAGIKFRN